MRGNKRLDLKKLRYGKEYRRRRIDKINSANKSLRGYIVALLSIDRFAEKC